MSDGLRVGVVGAGRMGCVRADACASLGARIEFVFDVDHRSARNLAARHGGCRWLEKSDEIDWNRIDAVFVCTPPCTRGPVELQAIQHGVAVFVEKPIGVTAEQLVPVLDAVASTNVQTAVGYMNRCRASVQNLRKELRQETILGMLSYWACGAYHVPWWADDAQSGGPLNEQLTHVIDLARYLVGDIVSVQAITDSRQPSRAALNFAFRERNSRFGILQL